MSQLGDGNLYLNLIAKIALSFQDIIPSFSNYIFLGVA